LKFSIHVTNKRIDSSDLIKQRFPRVQYFSITGINIGNSVNIVLSLELLIITSDHSLYGLIRYFQEQRFWCVLYCNCSDNFIFYCAVREVKIYSMSLETSRKLKC